MAFGINRNQLREWKKKADRGEIAFLTHYWLDDRYPGWKSVTKVACSDLSLLKEWGRQHGLKPEWIHQRAGGYPHFDLIGKTQADILRKEGLESQMLH